MKNTLSPVRTALTAAALLLASTNLFADNAPNSERVVSAGSAVTELLLALDAKDSLVAVDVTFPAHWGHSCFLI
ncbi:hemin ABC transporter, periplasmic hemin-binding protein HutB [Vibrio parahaemolyticus AQ3810]|nr:hemin ABC transporter, periplasmic hemin-binding protein HutB [Vibrio parahaemolyticus AQ3810]